ncbi:MAG: hypothetical protein FJ290_24975 [Planctomycetes bacterium]|nr:hypothetical protein [Planctomycetota bacterium]
MSALAAPGARLLLCLAAMAAAARCSGGEGQRIVGWRGDLTGRYPNATPPAEWGRWPKSPVRGLRAQAKKPQGDAATDGLPLEFAIPRDWLVLGPFPPVEKPLDHEFIPNEAEAQPDEGAKLAGLAWAPMAMRREGADFGNVLMDWLPLQTVLKEKGQAAYAHVYLHSQMGGKVAFVLDHQGACKAWVNGKVAYENPKPSVSLHAMNNISWGWSVDLALPFGVAARRVPVELAKGWNRVLFKATGPIHLRVAAEPSAAYEETNIAWMAKLTERSNASPIVVGDRIFVCSEPDELVCINKLDGRVLWRRSNGFYDATPEAERARNPVLQEKLAPLAEKLLATESFAERLALRRQMRELLLGVDKAKYEMKVEGHKVSHLPIVGWTTPTPVSDGRLVYVWFTHGVAACYDLDGNRKWIQRVDLLIRDPKAREGPYRYPCSPLLVDGKLVIGIVYEGMFALNAADGSLAWQQREMKGCMVSMSHATVRGTQVVFSPQGDVVRLSDGQLLWKHKLNWNIDGPVFQDGVLYLAGYGFSGLLRQDFTKLQGDSFEPAFELAQLAGVKGEGTYASPLLHEGLIYSVNSHGVLHVIDVKAKAVAYSQQLDLKPMFTYNACGVASSPTLGGKHIYAMDNQGNCVVFEPGRQFRQVARNQIQTQVHRDFPVNPQETLAYSNPVFDGSRLYIRGESHLYCIGER